MKRRNFVTGLCVGSIASVSGCMSGSGGSGGGGEGPSNTQSTSAGVEVNVEEVEIGTSFESGGSTYEPDEDHMFVFVRFRAENTADNAQPLPYVSDIQLVADSDQYDEYGTDVFSENNEINEPVTGDRYEGEDDARSGVVSEGWLIFEVPRDTEDIEISWAGGYEHDEFEASWEATLDSSQLPQIEGVEIEMAEEVEVGNELEIQILAENSGGGEGTLSTEVQIEVPGKDEQRFETDLVIPGESSESESVTVSSAVLGEIVVNIEEYDTAMRADVIPLDLSFDERIDVEEIPEIAIAEPEVSDYYEYEAYDGVERVDASSDTQFLLVEFNAQNRSSDTVSLPGSDAFVAQIGRREYEPTQSEYFGSAEFVEPVEGTESGAFGASLEPGDENTGIMLFEADSDDISEGIEIQGEWSLGFAVGETAVHWSD